MVAITATTYATPSAQAWQSRTRLEQARREADQAESNAKELRAQADDAEQQAQVGQAKVTTLSNQVAQADGSYARQQSNQATSANVTTTQDVLAPVATVAINHFSFPANPLKSYASATALGQLLGQRSGRFVNLLA
jgi:hypothetical protein